MRDGKCAWVVSDQSSRWSGLPCFPFFSLHSHTCPAPLDLLCAQHVKRAVEAASGSASRLSAVHSSPLPAAPSQPVASPARTQRQAPWRACPCRLWTSVLHVAASMGDAPMVCAVVDAIDALGPCPPALAAALSGHAGSGHLCGPPAEHGVAEGDRDGDSDPDESLLERLILRVYACCIFFSRDTAAARLALYLRANRVGVAACSHSRLHWPAPERFLTWPIQTLLGDAKVYAQTTACSGWMRHLQRVKRERLKQRVSSHWARQDLCWGKRGAGSALRWTQECAEVPQTVLLFSLRVHRRRRRRWRLPHGAAMRPCATSSCILSAPSYNAASRTSPWRPCHRRRQLRPQQPSCRLSRPQRVHPRPFHQPPHPLRPRALPPCFPSYRPPRRRPCSQSTSRDCRVSPPCSASRPPSSPALPICPPSTRTHARTTVFPSTRVPHLRPHPFPSRRPSRAPSRLSMLFEPRRSPPVASWPLPSTPPRLLWRLPRHRLHACHHHPSSRTPPPVRHQAFH